MIFARVMLLKRPSAATITLTDPERRKNPTREERSREKDMKKKTGSDFPEKILMEVDGRDEKASDSEHKMADEKKKKTPKAGNIYTDTIDALMKKNQKRVQKYYCANMKCPETFWSADLGYECPKCSSLGVISEFKEDRSSKVATGGAVVGYLDSIGRIVCCSCAERFGLENDIEYVIFRSSEPYCHESCEVCRADLTLTS